MFKPLYLFTVDRDTIVSTITIIIIKKYVGIFYTDYTRDKTKFFFVIIFFFSRNIAPRLVYGKSDGIYYNIM